MKLSILTPTYNREHLLREIYDSLLANLRFNLDFEWLIMDDGSTDNTKEVVNDFIKEQKINVQYFYQTNQGKAVALNNLIKFATGDLILDCDSDDYLASNAFKIIKEKAELLLSDSKLYALVFLKCDMYGEVSGKEFKHDCYRSTMFDLYNKEDIQGEKILLFKASIRKQYKHEVEENERFITEARMYHKMDNRYQVLGFNIPLIIGEYKKDGYTKNIQKMFMENPVGYYKYFTEMLNKDLKDVLPQKRIYMLKHYILFAYLSNKKGILKNLSDPLNKFFVVILFIPGYISSWNYKRKYKRKLAKQKGALPEAKKL